MHSKHLKHLILVAAVHLRALCTECTAQTKALSTQCKAGSAHSVLSACTVCGVAKPSLTEPTTATASERSARIGVIFYSYFRLGTYSAPTPSITEPTTDSDRSFVPTVHMRHIPVQFPGSFASNVVFLS